MLTRVIPLRAWTADVPSAMRVLPSARERADISEPLPPVDRLGRPLRELRISVIDRCNFRCVYCMPKAIYGRDHVFLPRDKLLGFDEIERAAAAFVALGVRKLRLTGGEPLLRSGIESLIARLAVLRTPDGRPVDLAMTTNGALLGRKAAALRSAGLRRLTVSLDAISDAVFGRMNDVDFPVSRVLEGIEAAIEAGFGPVKVNMVVKRGLNDGEIVPMARWFRQRLGSAAALRFIEYMDVGTSNRWRMDEVVPSPEVIARLRAHFPLEEAAAIDPTATARRYRYLDGLGEVATIASVTAPFCGGCQRARLSADGHLHTCLFSSHGHDLRPWLRTGGQALRAEIAAVWHDRADRYSELRGGAPPEGSRPRVEMHYIGG